MTQVERDSRSRLSRQVDYWRTVLKDLPDQLDLPTDHARPPDASYQGDTVIFEIDTELCTRLRELANQSRATLFMTLHAGLAGLLHRLGGGTDIPIGTDIAGRTDETIDDLTGFFVNTLVLRTDLSGNPTFRHLLTRTRDADLTAYDHQDLPFEQLVKALNPSRSLGKKPLFQVKVTLERQSTPVLTHGRATDPDRRPTVGARPDLSFDFRERTSSHGILTGLDGRLTYNRCLFDPGTARLTVERLVRLLANVAANPDQRLDVIDVLTPDERTRLLVDWNDTDRPIAEESLTDLFERQAAATADRLAVVSDTAELSYAELNSKANRLARYLIDLEVNAEHIVAVAMPPSIDTVATLLAILKTGAAYLPVDPGYPDERVAFMFDDALPKLILATHDVAKALPIRRDSDLVVLDSPKVLQRLADYQDTNVSDAERAFPLSPSNAAYVIYTSGSSGRPKGTVVEHRSLVNYVTHAARSYSGVHGTTLLHSSISFDLTVTGLYTPLTVGGCVCVATLDGKKSAAVMNSRRCTFVKATPSHLPLLTFLAEELSPDELLLGGELLTYEALRGWWKLNPGSTVTNAYGHTETTVNCAEYRLEASQAAGAGAIPIGRPFTNTQLYVLDAALSPAPVGVAGELYVAGLGVTRGYHGRPALTAERFMPNPFGRHSSRMYRTGDRARWRADGNLEFLGRVDDQVKIRGFRIEPGEIEAALTSHPAVERCAVIAREDRPGIKRLVAYVVPTTGTEVVPEDLYRHVAGKIPQYGLPSAVVTLDELPLTPNGKVDRRSLPAPDHAASAIGVGPLKTRDAVLCELFAEVLGTSEVAPDDNFFDLGGDSLLAIRLINRIRSTLNVELDLPDLFETATVAALTTQLDDNKTPRPRLRQFARPSRIPLSFAQQRLWFLNYLEGPSPTYNIPIAVRLSGHCDQAALQAALIDLVHRHEVLRTILPEADGEPYQLILDTETAQPRLAVNEVGHGGLDAVVAAAASVGFDLTGNPPLRASLFAVSESDSVLLLVLHHVAGDEWSLAPLFRDLSLAYRARCRGDAPQWDPMPAQYVDYTMWQRQILGDGQDPRSVLSRQVDYWRGVLTNLPDQLDLPTDHARPPDASYQGDTVVFELDAELCTRLREIASESRATLFMALHAGLAGLLWRLGAGVDIPIGTDVAGRTDESLDDLVGFFVNTLVLRTDVSGNPTFRHLLTRVRNVDLAAYAHQDVPFEQLVKALNPNRSLARNPLFQVMLVFQDVPHATLDLPELEVSRQQIHTNVAKFDLTFSVRGPELSTGEPGGLEITLEYASDLYNHETAVRLTRHMVQFLVGVAADPDRPIGDVAFDKSDGSGPGLEKDSTRSG